MGRAPKHTGSVGANGRAELLDMMNNKMAPNLTKTVPGINMLRVTIWSSAISQGLTPGDLVAAVRTLNAAGVVVEPKSGSWL